MNNPIRDEQETLGALLLSKTAITEVIDTLPVADFHNPAHRTIYQCIRDLYWRGQPADPVTVTIELNRRGDLFTIGGAPYLHTLISLVPRGAFQGGNTMTHPPNTELPCGAATHAHHHETSPGHLFHLCTKPAAPTHPWHGCACGLRWRCSTNPLGRTA